MTSRVHAGVGLAPDAVLPRRDDLLDEDLVAARLEELGRRAGNAPAVRACERVRARYRRGESLRATYRVDRPGRQSAGQRPDVHRGQGGLPVRPRPRRGRGRGRRPAGSVLFDEIPRHRLLGVPAGPQAARTGRPDLSRLPACGTCSPLPGRRASWWPTRRRRRPPSAARTRTADDGGLREGAGREEGRRSVETLRAVRAWSARSGDPAAARARSATFRSSRLALFSAAPGRPLHQLRARRRTGRDGGARRCAHGAAPSARPGGSRPSPGWAPGRLSDAGMLSARRDRTSPSSPNPSCRPCCSDPVRPTPAVLLHGDLHPKNVLVARHGDQPGRPRPGGRRAGRCRARRHRWPGCGARDRATRSTRTTASAAANALLAAYDRGAAARRPALVRRRGAPRRASGARRQPRRPRHARRPGAGADDGTALG